MNYNSASCGRSCKTINKETLYLPPDSKTKTICRDRKTVAFQYTSLVQKVVLELCENYRKQRRHISTLLLFSWLQLVWLTFLSYQKRIPLIFDMYCTTSTSKKREYEKNGGTPVWLSPCILTRDCALFTFHIVSGTIIILGSKTG